MHCPVNWVCGNMEQNKYVHRACIAYGTSACAWSVSSQKRQADKLCHTWAAIAAEFWETSSPMFLLEVQTMLICPQKFICAAVALHLHISCFQSSRAALQRPRRQEKCTALQPGAPFSKSTNICRKLNWDIVQLQRTHRDSKGKPVSIVCFTILMENRITKDSDHVRLVGQGAVCKV